MFFEIQKVRALAEESMASLTSDEHWTSESESGGDEEGVPKGEEAVDDQGANGQDVEGATLEGTPSDQVTMAED